MILCTGEALIDMLPEGGRFRPVPGGAVFNTAVALGRLGAEVGFLWPLSRDEFGAMLLGRLTEAGVRTDPAPRSDRLTALAFVTLEAGEARYCFYDEGSAGRHFAAADIPALDGVAAVFCGGISLAADPCGATVETLVQRAAPRAVVMIDPNIRPFAIADEHAYRARLDRMFRHADLVKMSAEDLFWLYPDHSPEDAARDLLTLGPRAIFVTRGAEGAEVHWRGGCLRAQAPAVALADSIGAGDTFNAGVLAALAEIGALDKARLAEIDETALRAALDLGLRAAAITVSRPGADPPWWHEL